MNTKKQPNNTYRILRTIEVNCWTEINATSKEEALEIAEWCSQSFEELSWQSIRINKVNANSCYVYNDNHNAS